MADEPQTSTAPLRDAKGRLVSGGGSLNPSGEHKWLADVKKELQGGSIDAAQYLNRVIKGEETFVTVVGKDATEVTLPVMPKDRIAAVKVLFEYLLPKPKAPEDDAEKATRNALAERILARLAGLDS